MKIIKIKNSCGGQGCEIKPYFVPMGIVKDIKIKQIKLVKLIKAA